MTALRPPPTDAQILMTMLAHCTRCGAIHDGYTPCLPGEKTPAEKAGIPPISEKTQAKTNVVKNDKARKEWLAGLKDGDIIASEDAHGVRVGKVSRSGYKRGGECFWLNGARYTVATGRKITRPGYSSTLAWLIPATDEIKRTHDITQKRERIIASCSHSGLRAFTDAQILAIAAILWPSEVQS